MISPQEFLDRWNSDIYGFVHYDESSIDSYNLSDETKEFLIKAGLPESAPPFLTFESSTDGGGVRLTEKNNTLGEMYKKFIYIGYNGSGNPVCIDETNSKLVYIDYDNENNNVFINSSISSFVESLLVYVDFIKKVKATNGRRAYLQKNATKELLDWIKHSLYQIDAISSSQGSFWKEELDSFYE
ncbi:SUKH-4 family immunity protein [Oceanobacillus senegalensis]|uniref:SUKH-4 family immunity protein n=1 Tax=Oceanobacillus senegalensis TaxID=1936063 RepID=UPI000A312D9E|nr:SUKH-4 family immunity protein [Oceanobacillus senegalensis]